MNVKTNPVALKEWDSAIQILAGGGQIILLRKGGIREETRRFELKSPSFYLYPTYEHQRPELVKEKYRHVVEESLAGSEQGTAAVSLTAYAEAVDDLELRDLEQLEKLYPYHMWSEGLAAERLRWKAKEPLHVLLLRVYKLEPPAIISVLPEYLGCRSWVQLSSHPEARTLKPVFDEAMFHRKCTEIRAALSRG